MKVFRELTIKGTSDQLAAFIDGIAPRLAGSGWGGGEYPQHDPPKMFCFTCPETAGRTASEIWVGYRGPNELYVSNVIPKAYRGQLLPEDYNEILREFYDRFALPVATEQHLSI